MTPDKVKDIFDYNQETGELIWKKRPDLTDRWNNKMPGKIAGTTTHGKIVVRVNKRHYFAHRLIWAIVYGDWPINDIDHIDHDPTNNRISNLRQATRSENIHNRRRNKNNTSGFKGVVFDKRRQKWRSEIMISGKRRFLGYFGSPEDAHKAYILSASPIEKFHHPG